MKVFPVVDVAVGVKHMKGVLERILVVRTKPFEPGDRLCHRLKVQEVEGILQTTEGVSDCRPQDLLLSGLEELHIPSLVLRQPEAGRNILYAGDTLVYKGIDLLRTDAGNRKDRRVFYVPPAVIDERALVRCGAVLTDRDLWGPRLEKELVELRHLGPEGGPQLFDSVVYVLKYKEV